MSGHDYDAGVTARLASIEGGSRQLVSIVRRRIAQALNALDDGDFSEAYSFLVSAQTTVVPLHQAQTNIAFADGAELIPIAEIQVGMEIIGLGVVEEVETTDCGGGCPGHLDVTVDGSVMRLDVGRDIYVRGGDHG